MPTWARCRRQSAREQQLTTPARSGDRAQARGNALGSLGLAYADLGEVQKAIGYYEQQLTITRRSATARGMPWATWNCLCPLGEVQKAIGYYEEALKIDRRIGDRACVGTALGNLGLPTTPSGRGAEGNRVL